MRLLFVGHNASRSGSPTVLLSLLRQLAATTEWELDLVLQSGGPLEPDFVTMLPSTRVLRGRQRRRTPWRRGRERIDGKGYHAVYCNSASSLLSLAPRMRSPVLLHLHELPWALRQTLPDEAARLVGRVPVRYIVPAPALKAMLMVEHGVADEAITIVPELIDVARITSTAPQQREGAPLVLGCGTIEWRKGTDLFLQLAVSYRTRYGDIARFAWLGGGSAEDEWSLRNELRKAGGGVELIAPTREPLPIIAASRVLAVTSREDPFPLVALEAGLLGRPAVCFRGAGGIEAMADAGGGFAVPYLDVAAMVERLHDLLHDDDLHRRAGAAARQFAQRCDAVSGASRIADIIAETVALTSPHRTAR